MTLKLKNMKKIYGKTQVFVKLYLKKTITFSIIRYPYTKGKHITPGRNATARCEMEEIMRGVHSAVDDIRRTVFAEVARLAYDYDENNKEKTRDQVDIIPYKMIPGDIAKHRHDVYLERAIIIARIRLALGMNIDIGGHLSTHIDEAVTDQKYFENPVPENMPILEDLYNALLAQEESEARHVATALEIYVKGSLNLFNHRTNVDISNRIVCYDIKELGKQLKKIGMLIVQDQVWGRVTENRSEGKATRYYMDEFHLLLKEEQTAAYSVEIWKRFRKWGGIPTGITQNVKDLLASREVTNIFENSDYIFMLNQAAGDRQILAQQLNISPHQLSYVTHSGEGEGLLFYGNVVLPFVDHFPTDLELYKVLTTKLSEVTAAKAG